jgi:hypothetical protein
VTEPRKYLVGVFPTGRDEMVTVDEVALAMIAEARRKADIANLEAARRQQRAVDDAERARKTARGVKLARTARRFRAALKTLRA